jgi:hypothetical protein
MYCDFVAHCRWPLAPLCEREAASWLWAALQRMFPSAIAAALMPNHLHLVAPTMDANRERERLRRLLASFAREFELGHVWSPVPEPKPLLTKDKVARQVRYVSLNPCRPFHLGNDDVVLAADPLGFEWTTHRDAVGAIVDPWVTAAAIAEAAGVDTMDPVAWLHKYVSSDPHVAVAGTPAPIGALSGALEQLVLAVCAAHRVGPDAIRRRGPARKTFLSSAARLGLDNKAVAEAADMHPVAAARRMRDDPIRVDPALLCLGDARLLVRTDFAPAATSRAVGLDGIPRQPSKRNGRAVPT